MGLNTRSHTRIASTKAKILDVGSSSRVTVPRPSMVTPGDSRFQLVNLEKDPTLPQGYLSVTQVEMYLRCAKQYEFRYIKKVKAPPAVALVEGGCHHEALSVNNSSMFTKRKPAKKNEVIETFSDSFADRSISIPKSEWKLSGENKDGVIKRGEAILNLYMDEMGESFVPVNPPEEKVELLIGGVPVLMFIDVEEASKLVDYKVVSSSKSESETKNDLQLTTYAMAKRKNKVAFCCLVKGTVAPRIKLIEADRTNDDFAVVNSVFEGVADAVRKGAFPMCNPTSTFPCSEKWCGYWKMCRGGMKGRTR